MKINLLDVSLMVRGWPLQKQPIGTLILAAGSFFPRNAQSLATFP